jgi:isopenicillin N synthase-like dioxygenase
MLVPLLDLALPPEELATTCRDACELHGFMFIANHGIPQAVIDAHAAAQRRFFSLPPDRKSTILADANNRGYTPPGDETLDPKHSSQGDAKEGLYFGREVPADHPDAVLPLHGPNQWPDEAVLGLPGYRDTVEAYLKAVTALGMRLLPVVATALGLSPTAFEPYFHKPMTFLRPLRYPPVRSDEAKGQFAAGAHSDYGFLTLLWTDGTPGLQIQYKGDWIDVTPPKVDTEGGVFIVNLGDMLERWSGGRFASTVHRVINPSGAERHSCAFFFEPFFDAVVEPVPGSSEEALQKYPAITSGRYLLDKYAATHAAYAEKMETGEAKKR